MNSSGADPENNEEILHDLYQVPQPCPGSGEPCTLQVTATCQVVIYVGFGWTVRKHHYSTILYLEKQL